MATMERARRGRGDERDGHGDRDGGGRREDTKAPKRILDEKQWGSKRQEICLKKKAHRAVFKEMNDNREVY